MNINHIKIYRRKCIDIVTLKVLPTSCFHYNSVKKSTKFPNPKMKLSKIGMSFPVQVLKFYNKMFRGSRENDKFLKILLRIYQEFTHSFQSFTKCFSYLIAWQFGDSYKWRVDCWNGGIFALISHTLSISKIFFPYYKQWLKFKLFLISKFRFDRVHGKMLHDTHLMVKYLKYFKYCLS